MANWARALPRRNDRGILAGESREPFVEEKCRRQQLNRETACNAKSRYRVTVFQMKNMR